MPKNYPGWIGGVRCASDIESSHSRGFSRRAQALDIHVADATPPAVAAQQKAIAVAHFERIEMTCGSNHPRRFPSPITDWLGVLLPCSGCQPAFDHHCIRCRRRQRRNAPPRSRYSREPRLSQSAWPRLVSTTARPRGCVAPARPLRRALAAHDDDVGASTSRSPRSGHRRRAAAKAARIRSTTSLDASASHRGDLRPVARTMHQVGRGFDPTQFRCVARAGTRALRDANGQIIDFRFSRMRPHARPPVASRLQARTVL